MPKSNKIENSADIIRAWSQGLDGIQYIQNRGNAGDAIIASATHQVFDQLGLHTQQIKIDGILPRANIIISGGGNLIGNYADVKHMLDKCLSVGINQCLILPHSIRGHEDTLAQLDARFTIVCRDWASYAFVQQHAPKANIKIAPDIAFSLDCKKLIAQCQTRQHKLALLKNARWVKNYMRWKMALKRIQVGPNNTLTILRRDSESTNKSAVKRKHDLMRFAGVRWYDSASDQITADLIALFATADHIITDRLHVSILASLLGKKVCLLENTYGKLADVWTLHMQANTPKTRTGPPA